MTESQDLPELKDCPFCGCRPAFYDYYSQFWVECGCGLQTGKEYERLGGKEKVIEEWNSIEPGEYLKSLIKRDTPERAIFNGYRIECPSCHNHPGSNNFCPNCGQRIDNGGF